MAEAAALIEMLKGMKTWFEENPAGRGRPGEKRKDERDILSGKGFDVMEKFGGGVSEWNEWSGDFKTMAETRSDMAAEALAFVKSERKNEKEVMTWDEVMMGLKNGPKYVDEEEKAIRRFERLGKGSREMHRWLRLKTEGEAKLVVIAEEKEAYGFKVWDCCKRSTIDERWQD